MENIINELKKELEENRDIESCISLFREDYLENGEKIQIQIKVTAENDDFIPCKSQNQSESTEALPIGGVSNIVCSLKNKGFCPYELKDGYCKAPAGDCINQQTCC